VVKGDGLSFSIAAASIYAKELRDRLMVRLAARYPEFCWENNAGYGTAAHLNGLKTAGLTPHHRLSFRPVALQQRA
jgi:ribonuclease HII